MNIIEKVQRYSMKYVDLIESDSIENQIAKTNISIKLGDHEIASERYSLRLEQNKDGIIHVVSIFVDAKAQIKGVSDKKHGVIVDVDSVKMRDDIDFNTRYKELPDALDVLHLANKKKFFECLTIDTIHSLEPVYE